MPLSEHEQRLFEEIERSLADDPKFASAVRSSDPRYHARRRIFLAILLLIAGLTLLVVGAIRPNAIIGVLGFVVMLGAAVFGLQSHRKSQTADLRVVGEAESGKPARSKRGKNKRGGSILDRLEERWRRRPESRQ